MKYIVIGLGNYGSVLAEELTSLGHEVIGVDQNAQNVDRMKDKVATVYVVDATDEAALTVLPLQTVDVVIVAIGENFGASIRVVSLLKKNKVKHIYARALDDIHKSVLEAFSIDRVLTPEKDAACMLVRLLELNIDVESFQIDEEHFVFKFGIPRKLVGCQVNDLKEDEDFNLKLLALVRGKMVKNSLGISVLEKEVDNMFPEDYTLQEEDRLVCYGLYKDFVKFWKSIGK